VFVFPRVVEGIWYFLNKKQLINDIPHGLSLIFAIFMGIAFVLKSHYKELCPKNYIQQFDFFFSDQVK